MKKILFCCYGGGHVQCLLPVIKELQSTGLYEIRVFALTTSQEVFRSNNINYFTYKDIPSTKNPSIQELGKRYLKTLTVQKTNTEETIAYLGSNIQELINQYGFEKAEERYSAEGRACFYPLSLMKTLLQHEKPDLLVATNSPRTEKAIIQAASDLNIPALCVVDSFAIYESQWISAPSFGKYVCVLSDSVKQRFIKENRPEKDIYITGNPAFDPFLSDLPQSTVKNMKEKIGATENQKIILYAPSPEGSQHIFSKKPADPLLPEKILEKLTSIAQQNNNLFLIIRPHPSQKFSIRPGVPNIFYDEGNDLKLMLSLADLVLTLGSTVGLQAQLMGKPLICSNQSVYANDTIYEDFGPVTRVYSMEELEESVNKHVKTEKKLDVKKNAKIGATKKITNLIETILEQTTN